MKEKPKCFNFRHSWTSRLGWPYSQVTRWLPVTLDFHSTLFTTPKGAPEFDFMDSDPVSCLSLNQSLYSRVSDVLPGHYGKHVTATEIVRVCGRSGKVGAPGKLQCFYQKTRETAAGQTKKTIGGICHL